MTQPSLPRKLVLLVTFALAGIVFGLSSSPSLADHYRGHHYKSYGDNEANGRLLYFDDQTTAGYWDYADVQGQDSTAYWWNIAGYYSSGPKAGKFDYLIQRGAVSPYLFGEFGYPGSEILFLDGYYGTGPWCGGQQGSGCMYPYYEPTYPNGHSHLMVGVMYGNRDYTDGWSAKRRKYIKCQEMGHALGLAHTGEGDHEPRNSCMDVGALLWNNEYPDFEHDTEILHTYYRGETAHLDDFGPPVGAPVAGTEPTGGNRYPSPEAFLRAHEPPELRKLVEAGKLVRGKPFATEAT